MPLTIGGVARGAPTVGCMATALRHAFVAAGRLGHGWVGPDHVLLALLRADRPSTPRDVLEELGLDHGDVARRLHVALLDASP